jgi:hypothetical protein
MQGDGQLDDAQAGTEMPTGLADRVEQFQAQLIGQGFQLGFAQRRRPSGVSARSSRGVDGRLRGIS